MKVTTILSSLLLAVPSLARTPSGFTPGTNETLDVYYGTQYISPGLIIKKSSRSWPLNEYLTLSRLTENFVGTQKAPLIGLTNTTLTGKYLLAMIGMPIPLIYLFIPYSSSTDIDGSSNGRATTVLHALLIDYTSANTLQNGTSVLKTSATGPSSYFGPAPPAGQPLTHRYVFLLHEQPANFAVPAAHKQAVSSRLGIDWVKFVADAGLKAPVAGNYLQVKSGDSTRRRMGRLNIE
jgi:hypothetical protein